MKPLQTSVSGAGAKSLVIRPNRSLPVAGMVTLFVAASALALTIGIGFTLAGAWMVLPFAVLEVLILGALCGWFYRHRDDCELVVVEPDRVWITKRKGAGVSRHEFARYWVRMVWQPQGNAGGAPRLLIGSHGKFVGLGEDISEADRALVARELKGLLRAPA